MQPRNPRPAAFPPPPPPPARSLLPSCAESSACFSRRGFFTNSASGLAPWRISGRLGGGRLLIGKGERKGSGKFLTPSSPLPERDAGAALSETSPALSFRDGFSRACIFHGVLDLERRINQNPLRLERFLTFSLLFNISRVAFERPLDTFAVFAEREKKRKFRLLNPANMRLDLYRASRTALKVTKSFICFLPYFPPTLGRYPSEHEIGMSWTGVPMNISAPQTLFASDAGRTGHVSLIEGRALGRTPFLIGIIHREEENPEPPAPPRLCSHRRREEAGAGRQGHGPRRESHKGFGGETDVLVHIYAYISIFISTSIYFSL